MDALTMEIRKIIKSGDLGKGMQQKMIKRLGEGIEDIKMKFLVESAEELVWKLEDEVR